MEKQKELLIKLEVTFQPINRCWGVHVTNENITFGEVGENLEEVMSLLAKEIVRRKNIGKNHLPLDFCKCYKCGKEMYDVEKWWVCFDCWYKIEKLHPELDIPLEKPEDKIT